MRFPFLFSYSWNQRAGSAQYLLALKYISKDQSRIISGVVFLFKTQDAVHKTNMLLPYKPVWQTQLAGFPDALSWERIARQPSAVGLGSDLVQSQLVSLQVSNMRHCQLPAGEMSWASP